VIRTGVDVDPGRETGGLSAVAQVCAQVRLSRPQRVGHRVGAVRLRVSPTAATTGNDTITAAIIRAPASPVRAYPRPGSRQRRIAASALAPKGHAGAATTYFRALLQPPPDRRLENAPRQGRCSAPGPSSAALGARPTRPSRTARFRSPSGSRRGSRPSGSPRLRPPEADPAGPPFPARNGRTIPAVQRTRYSGGSIGP
jgi:hypothetical protein